MASDGERREQLLAQAERVRGFFENTSMHSLAGRDPWSIAFEAVRRNEYMAESFLVELRGLLEFIDSAFAAPAPKPMAPVAPPPRESGFHEEATMIKMSPVSALLGRRDPPPPPPIPAAPPRAPAPPPPVPRARPSTPLAKPIRRPAAPPARARSPFEDFDTSVATSPGDPFGDSLDESTNESTDRVDLPPESPRRRR